MLEAANWIRQSVLVYADFMDDDYEGWMEDDFISGMWVALDRLEELDPQCRKEEWFRYLVEKLDNLAGPTRH